MVPESDKERVQGLLTQAITILCKNSLPYSSHVSVQGLLGITLDDRDIFLVNIKEVVQSELAGAASENRKNRNRQSSSSSVDQTIDGTAPFQRTLTPTLNRTTNKACRGRKRTSSGDAGTTRKAVCYENIQQINDDEDELVIVKQEHFGNFCRSPGVETESVETEKETNFSSTRSGDGSESSAITCIFEEKAHPIRNCEETLDNHGTEDSGKHDTDTQDNHNPYVKEEFYNENSLQDSGENGDSVSKCVKEELADTLYDPSESALEYISDIEQREVGQYTSNSNYNQALDYTSVDPSASAMNVMSMMSQGHLLGMPSSSASWASSTPTTQRHKATGLHSQTMTKTTLYNRIARKILLSHGPFTTQRQVTRAVTTSTDKVMDCMSSLMEQGLGFICFRGATKLFVKNMPQNICEQTLAFHNITTEEYYEYFQKDLPGGIPQSVKDFVKDFYENIALQVKLNHDEASGGADMHDRHSV